MSRVKDENDLVVPGDLVYEGTDMYANSGTYEEDDKIYSKYAGVVRHNGQGIQVVPMSGRYIPSEGDVVIGEVSRVSYSRWTVDLNSPYDGTLGISEASEEYVDLDEEDLTDYFEVGDAIVVKVDSVSESMDVDLTMKDRRCKKLHGGRVIEIAPSKVPRVIGKKGTMVKQINEKTGCNIIVGQNGQVWISGDNPNLAARAVKKVEREAHTRGLTEKIGEWLDEQAGDR
ncbi:MAG: exosome complex RNA-binding protein Rrp4 [Candidatus Nanohaloarchaea archaeon]